MGFWDQVKRFLGLGGPGSPPAPRPARPIPAASRNSGGEGAPAEAATSASAASYRNDAILGLSADELRRRALQITPWRTAWIGRVDTIPPQSDERTAIIDRGLLLRGLLTDEQLTEIHRVGDLWLRHRHAKTLAESRGEQAGAAAVAAAREARAARKAEKQAAAARRREERASALARWRETEIVYLGRGVSGSLGDHQSDVARLTAQGLPVLATPADVATALGVSVPHLRWLAYHSEAVERSHYLYFAVPKRSGGVRQLAAPHRRLAAAQDWIRREILDRLPTEPPAHGFVAGRSTVTNALPHVGRPLVVNLDLENYFPTINFARVRGVFERFGYSPAAATVLALLTTEPPRRAVDYDGVRYWVAVGERALPQGACTSPALANQTTRKLDRRLAGMAERHGWTYTRYADDLTFSRPDAVESVAVLLARVRHIVGEEGFVLHPEKGRIQRPAGRQSVTGIVVNAKPGIGRDEVRRLRAILHGARRDGLAAQNREGVPNFTAWLRGKIAYLQMVDRAKGDRLRGELAAIMGAAPESPPEPRGRSPRRERSTHAPVPPPVGRPVVVPVQSPPAAPPAAVATSTATGATAAAWRTFELIGDGSRKFWWIKVEGARHTVRFGRIGTAGQEKVKDFASGDAARKDAERLLREKLGKGYAETATSR